MGRPKTVSDEDLRQTARRCFLEHGPNLSIGTIAAELGISDAAIIKRVGSKEKLLRSCLSGGPPMHFLSAMRSGPIEGPLAEQLERHLEAITEVVKERIPSLIAIRLSDIDLVEFISADDREPPPITVRRELGAWLDRAKDTHDVELRDPDAIAELLVSTAQIRAFHSWISHGTIPESKWTDLVRSVLPVNGLKPQ